MAITTMELNVDLTTYQTWLNHFAALRRRRTVNVVAVDDVSGLPQLPGTLEFSGLRLLREVGLASSRPNVLNDAAHYFALLKYATAIHRARPFALVNDLARADQHKKKVLSDEFGTGFAFLAARRLFGVTRFLDLRQAIDDQIVVIEEARSEQPDFIALGDDGKALLVLEAKGTQSGHRYSTVQLQRGCQQVGACLPSNAGYNIVGRMTTGISLVREIHQTTSILHISDPPPPEQPSLTFKQDPYEAVVRSHFSRLAALTGDERLDRSVRDSLTGVGLPLSERQRAKSKFFGARLLVRHGKQDTLDLFIGLEEGVRDMLIGNAPMEANLRAFQKSAEIEVELAYQNTGFRRWQDLTVTGRAQAVKSPVRKSTREPQEPKARVRTAATDPFVGYQLSRTQTPAESPQSFETFDELSQPAVISGEDGSILELAIEGPLLQKMYNEENG